jgi:putative SOS response-associated peptidase YedK
MTNDPDISEGLEGPTGHGPGTLGLVIRRHPQTNARHMDKLSWGLLPHDTEHPLSAPRPIHARAETVATQPMFADAFRSRRAIVPANEYFQRQTKGRAGRRYAISRADGQPMALAGLWEGFRWPDGRIDRTYCLITIEASGPVAVIHDRMPLVLDQADWPVWLGEQLGDVEALLRPPPEGTILCRPVGRQK